MKQYMIRLLVPQETLIAAENPAEAKIMALRLLQLHAAKFAPGVLFSLEPLSGATTQLANPAA